MITSYELTFATQIIKALMSWLCRVFIKLIVIYALE